jgi:hypothetical protein
MNPNKLSRSFQLFYESPINVPAPYHLEAVFTFKQFDTEKPTVAIEIQYIDRSDFSREELIADGLVPDDHWTFEGDLPLVWRDRLLPQFQEYVTGSCSPKDQEPFITLEANDTTPNVPLYLEPQETLIQEFMQAMFEIDGRELPLYLGFQFKDRAGNWRKIEGVDSEEGNKSFSNWDELQELMNHVFIAEFQADKANQNCKTASLAVYPGDGLWYVAGHSLRKPSGNNYYFDELEEKLQFIF